MKKALLLLTVAALFMGVTTIEAKQVTIVTELLGTTDDLADNAIDTLTVVPLDRRLVWAPDEDASTGAPLAWVAVAFTASGMDSFRVYLDVSVGEIGSTHYITTTSFVARTSGAMFVVPLTTAAAAGGFSLRVRLDNADITGGAACTNLDAYLIQVIDQ